MKKMILGLMVVAVAAMTVTSCKKYEDGPGFSLRTKTGRLAGTWEVDKYITSNGTESQDNSNAEISFQKDGTYKYKSDGFSEVTGTWEFDDDKENITTTFTYDLFGTQTTITSTSKILRLTNSEFWYEDEDGDKTYLKEK